MKRRTCVRSVVAGIGSLAIGGAPASSASPDRSGAIQLHVDLSVDPARERELLQNFKTVFRPAAEKQPGYIDVQLVKLRSPLQGSAPAGLNYRFVLTYSSEELRQKWVTSETHARVWPAIEKTLSSTKFTVLLFDIA